MKKTWIGAWGLSSLALALTLAFAPSAQARSNYQDDCLRCHDGVIATDFNDISVCNGCHVHGVYADGSGNDNGGPLNLVATTDMTTYAETDDITFSLTAGYRNGNARMEVFHPVSGSKIAEAFGPINLDTPLSVTVPASDIGPGTFQVPVGWFGNATEFDADLGTGAHNAEQVLTAAITIEEICVPTGPEDLATPGTCTDGLDNDCDGLIDAMDPGCIAGCTDMDGDGFAIEGGTCGPIDCNDMDPSVYPGAAEVCNGIDDNCDGQIDEGVQLTFYADADGDMYGDPAVMTMACDPPMGYVADNTDCDDTDPAVNPGAPEICDNMVDDNCNGLVDGDDPACGGTMMPPPVNQNLGIADVDFNNLMEDDCRACHGPNPPPGVPVDTTYLPDRHHLLVGTPIEDNPSVDIPNPDADGDGVPDTTFDCLNCHNMQWTGTTWELVQDFRDCLNCHVASPHHVTAQAQAGNCLACHQWLDDGLADSDGDGIQDAVDPDGGWIPTYQVSLVTPFPGEMDIKPNGGDVNPINNVPQGNCSYCHDAGTTPDGLVVQKNSVNHHNTGFFDDPTKCVWCHSFDVPAGDPRALTPIRTCGNCHGIPSLHNIQAKSDGTPADETIVPGAEAPWFGHIGSQTDCNGCHGFSAMVSGPAPGSGPLIPQIDSITPATATAGQSTTLTITGQALTNLVPNPYGGEDVLLGCDLVLEAADGTETVVTPDTITQSSMTVVLQPELAAGNYTVRADKSGKISNPMILPVLPAVTVASADCSGNTVTIVGSGFGSYLEATDSGTSVTATITTEVLVGYDKKGRPQYETTTETVAGAVFSWTDTEIVADFDSCPTEVTVNSVYGSTTATLGGGSEPPTDPPTASCADYSDEASCSADPACEWSVNKKGRGSCVDAGGGDTGGSGGKPPKNK